MSAPRWIASRLERGALLPSLVSKPLERNYASFAARALARPVDLPSRTPVIGVGSALLGGAGKTPVAIAYARALADHGARVALVSHGFRARPGRPHIVLPTHPLRTSGDDALVAAMTLIDTGVQVWAGEDRGQTLAAAARHADVIVADGLLQAHPRPVARSVLVLDARRPFGTGRCPPGGDLRASAADIVSRADEVVLVSDVLGPRPRIPEPARSFRTVRTAWLELTGLVRAGRRRPLSTLFGQRVGLLTFLARPERIETSLSRRGIRPVCRCHGPDHGPASRPMRACVLAQGWKSRVDAWVGTMKCVTHVGPGGDGRAIWGIEMSTRLDPTPSPVLDSPPCVPRES